MGQFDRQLALAQRLIKKNGQAVVYRQFTTSDPEDPSKPWNQGADSFVDHNVFIVFLSANRTDERFLQLISGTELSEGVFDGLMAGQDFNPTLKDVVIRGDETLQLNTVDDVAPNGQIILHKLEFKKSS